MSVVEKRYWTEGIEEGIKIERERILSQWEYEMKQCKCDHPLAHMERRIKAEIPVAKEKADG